MSKLFYSIIFILTSLSLLAMEANNDINALDEITQLTPLQSAVFGNDEAKVIELLADNKIDLFKQCGKHKWTALKYAIYYDRLNLAKLIYDKRQRTLSYLNRHALIAANERGLFGGTAILATFEKDANEKLESFKAKIEEEMKSLEETLIDAVKRNRPTVAEFLLDRHFKRDHLFFS